MARDYDFRKLIFPYIALKVPKRENFSLMFFALSKPIWVCDLGNGKKSNFFAAYWMCGKPKKT